MRTRLIALVIVVCPTTKGGGAGHGAGASSGSNSASVEVGGQSGGKPASKPTPVPAKPSSCTPWTYTIFAGKPPAGLKPKPGTSLISQLALGELYDSSGRRYRSYNRTCNGVSEDAWVADKTGKELAADAYSQATARAPSPRLASAPPTDQLIVNLETWFGVTPIAPVSATASIPGLSATVTLRPESIRVDTGSGTVLRCGLWGSSTSKQSGCAWTPDVPSIPKFTGGGYAFVGTVTLVWRVSWTATDGTGGTLDPIETSAPLRLAVREIQTVGAKG